MSVALIICTYNRAALLKRAVASALAQTDADFTVHVVADGCTDDTASVLASFVDPRLHVLAQPNAGLAASRRAGVAASSAEWITFLDDDDHLLPAHLSARVALAARYPAVDLWQGGFAVVGDPYVTDYYDRRKRVHTDAVVVGATFFMRRHVFDALGGFAPLPWGDDTDFWERARSRFVCAHVREPRTYVWERAPGTMSTRV